MKAGYKLIFSAVLSSAILLTGCSSKILGQAATTDKPLAFPGAEGFGKYTTGGRGGKVYIVTNLNDDGPGSLRQGVKAKGPRTIVFAVSGTIGLESPLKINNGDLTIAGQSAPGDGICIKNFTTTISASNVILRYLRFRLGDERKSEDDALNGNQHDSDIIIDHCSMSWSVDEAASFYYNHNFTMQWCIISESLTKSVHTKGPHGYGGIWGGEGASYHHNLLANHSSRNPRFSGSTTTMNPIDELVDFSNNVIYNWGMNSTYGGEKGKYNMVNNYYKPGPATPKNRRNRIVNPWSPYGQFYIAGNRVEGDEKISKDNWAGGVQGDHVDSARVNTAFKVEPIGLQSAEDAYKSVLKYAGASYKRDAVDERVLRETADGSSNAGGTHNGLIDSQIDVGGWPVLKSLPAFVDTDMDGMPDDWEKKNKLNADDASDASAYKLNKQYTNLEVYLNSLVAGK
jgi:pectate lyase